MTGKDKQHSAEPKTEIQDVQPASFEGRAEMAEKFLNLLFGNVKERKFGYLWTKPDKTTYPFDVSSVAERREMARKAIELSNSGFDVYVGINLTDTAPTANARVTAEHVTLQTASVCDVDIAGGKHVSSDTKVYPPNFATARVLLPFKPSLLINSGYGLHGYCIYSEPITITADNRSAAEERNKKFLDAIRIRAGVFAKAVDSVGDLPRVLRMPGTFNFKLGRDNAPLCRLVEVNDIKFTPADFDARLKTFAGGMSKPTKPKSEAPKQCRSTGDQPSEQERAIAMLEKIPCAELSRDDWVNVGMALKNIGCDCGDWEQWSRADDRFKDGECEKLWAGFNRDGLNIGTVHDIAKRYGYSEKDFQRNWHAERRQDTDRTLLNLSDWKEVDSEPPADEAAVENQTAPITANETAAQIETDAGTNTEIRKAITDWRQAHSNDPIDPETVKEIEAAVTWLNGLTVENFETEYSDDVHCRHSVALIQFYAPHLMRKLYNVARAAKIPCLSPSAIESNVRYYVNQVEKNQRNHTAQIAKADYERKYRERWEENQREREKSKFKLDDEQVKYLFSLDTSDLSNAMRLNFIFGDDVRFLADLDRWLTFDKNQGVWRRGVTGNTAILPFAGKLAAMLMSNLPKIDVVSQAPEKPDPIIKTWKNSAKVSSAIIFLKAVERIRITTDDLDNHKNLLNCKNGVVDLETGKFYESVDRTLLLTQQCGAAYVKDASNTDIEKFFKDVLPDETTRAALIRWLGYCLTGNVNEEKSLFIWGRGGNGKGTLTKLLMTLLADYAASVPVNAVIETGRMKDAGAATAELNVLDKCRLGIVEELPQGGRLDVAKFKSLTGGDKIPVRRLYEEFHNIEPTHKLILSGNHQPVLSDPRDPGLLRRLLNMNFCTDFTQNPDLHLKEKLLCHTALSSLLSILVKAAQDWYQHGLIVSNLMKNATMSYLAENDFVSEFIDEHCVFGEERSIDRKSFLNKIKNEYTAECLRMSDRMIIDTVRNVDGISYRRGGASGGYRFFGIGWRRTDASDEFSGERVNDDYALPDET